MKSFIVSTPCKVKSVSEKARPGSVQCTRDQQHHCQTAPDRTHWRSTAAVSAGWKQGTSSRAEQGGWGRASCWAQNQQCLPGEGAAVVLPGGWRALRVTMHRKVSARKGFSAVVTGHTYSSRGPGPCKAGAGGRLTTWATAARHRESEKQKTKHHQSEQGYCQGNYSPTDEYTQVKSKLNME